MFARGEFMIRRMSQVLFGVGLCVLAACPSGGSSTSSSASRPVAPGPGPAGPGPASTSAGGNEDPEAAWHARVTEAAAKISEHDDVKSGCGHDVTVVFDWPSYPTADYKPDEEKYSTPPPSRCGADMLQGLATRCGDTKKSGAVMKVQTLTCHHKACKDVRTETPLDPGSTPTDNGMAEYKYELSADGTNIDVFHCPASSVFTAFSAYQWTKKHF
jgi:hypothetical protein